MRAAVWVAVSIRGLMTGPRREPLAFASTPSSAPLAYAGLGVALPAHWWVILGTPALSFPVPVKNTQNTT